MLFEQQPTFDAMGNVSALTTTLPAGTDQQAFCYDEQDRLTWASAASGTIPCGGTNTAGTLTGASYTQSFAYDNLGRLTSGPLGQLYLRRRHAPAWRDGDWRTVDRHL